MTTFYLIYLCILENKQGSCFKCSKYNLFLRQNPCQIKWKVV